MLKFYLLVSVLAANGTFPAPDFASSRSFTSYDDCVKARIAVYEDAIKRRVSLVAKCEAR